MFKRDSTPEAPSARSASKATSVLGPTLSFKGGELSADEDLIIEGTVEGSIAHQNHNLTIGKNGKVKADVKARTITVHGSIEGDLHGDEGVYITSTAYVRGNVTSPQVSLERGANFQGGINTTPQATASGSTTTTEKASPVSSLAGSAGVRARRQHDGEPVHTEKHA